MSFKPQTLLEMMKAIQGQSAEENQWRGLQGLGGYGYAGAGAVASGGYLPAPSSYGSGSAAIANAAYSDSVHTANRQVALACFHSFMQVGGRDALRAKRHSDGCWYESQYADISRDQWWRKIEGSEHYPAKPEDVMKNFTEKQLADGQFETLERIETPQPGAAFDMNKLAVSAVLTLNTAVQIIQDLQARIDKLEALARAQPAESEEVAEFSLPKLGDGYKDVTKDAA
jgi:hypothetical protein